MLKRLKNQKGFTLIELIAVIAIIAILAVIIVPRVGSYNKKAQVSKAKSNLVVLKNAIERYNAEHDAELGSGETSLSTLTMSDGNLGPYIDKVPSEFDDLLPDEVLELDPDDITVDKIPS